MITTIKLRRMIAILALLCMPLFVFAEKAAALTDGETEEYGIAEAEEWDMDIPLEEEEEESTAAAEMYIATNTMALKVRRGPGAEYNGMDSIAKGSQVFLLEIGEEWSRIRIRGDVGYVQTKYLEDIYRYDADLDAVGDAVEMADKQEAESETEEDQHFHNGFKAFAVKNAVIYEQPDAESRYRGKAPIYKELVVCHNEDNGWSHVKYDKVTGYTLTQNLFKWDRLEPFAGDIPGRDIYPYLAFVNRSADILEYNDKREVLKTINPGSAIAVAHPDEAGRYKTPYWRTTGYVKQEDIAFVMPVVPYEDAQPGDLISAMTTYYAIGKHTLQYQGRNWNIYLSTSRISDAVIQPDEVFDIYQYIGPYRKSSGYKSAPIASPTALMGYGGGTCQVSTTLYNGIIQVPLYVNHRKVHADAGAKYIPKGFDAAVGGGDINLVFTNTLPYPIRLNFFMSDGVLTFCIFRV